MGIKKNEKKKGAGLRRVLAVFGLFFSSVFLLSEFMVFALYALPLISIWIAQTQGVGMDAEWMIAVVVWGLPSLFVTLACTALHVWLFARIGRRLGRWAKRMWFPK